MRSVYGESTKLRLFKGVNPVENVNVFKRRVVSHEGTIVQPSTPNMKVVYSGPTRSVRRTSGFVQVAKYLGIRHRTIRKSCGVIWGAIESARRAKQPAVFRLNNGVKSQCVGFDMSWMFRCAP